MNILLAYGHDEFTTGGYYERALRKRHNVLFCGTPSFTRPEGFPLFTDLGQVLGSTGFKPDLYIYLDAGYPCFPLGVEHLDCPTAGVMFDLYPNSDAEAKAGALRLFDYAFVSQKQHVADARRWSGIEANWLPYACDPEVHRAGTSARDLDIGFVGSLGKTHRRRERLLADLSRRYKLNDYRRRYLPAEMSQVYGRSKLVVNFTTPWQDLNMRTFEAMACGAMLLTPQEVDGQADVFRSGEHLVTCATDEDLRQKIEHYLRHEEERARIAAAGQQLVTASHTYDRRVERILQAVFEQGGGAKRSPMRGAAPEQVNAVVRPYLAMLISRNLLQNISALRSRVGGDWRLVFRALRNLYRAVSMPRR